MLEVLDMGFLEELFMNQTGALAIKLVKELNLEIGGWICIHKYVKDQINANIGKIVDWDSDRSFGTKVGRGDNSREENDIYAKVGSGYGK